MTKMIRRQGIQLLTPCPCAESDYTAEEKSLKGWLVRFSMFLDRNAVQDLIKHMSLVRCFSFDYLILNNKDIMCNFPIEYPKPKDEMVEQLKAAIEFQTEGIFSGDTSSGEFSFSAKGFSVAGNYTIIGDTIEVSVTKKPWLLSCRKIESEIRKYLENQA